MDLIKKNPVLYEPSTLNKTPEFSEAVDDCKSRLNTSASFFEFLVSSFKPGLYLSNASHHAFYVSIDQEKISFRICGLRDNLYDVLVFLYGKKSPNECLIPLSKIKEFFTNFSNEYVLFDEKTISLYNLKPYAYFFINHSTDRLHWAHYGSIYHLENDAFYVRTGLSNHLRLIPKENRTLRVECQNKILLYCHCNEKITELEPISLKQFLLHENNNPVFNDENTIEFKAVEDEHFSVKSTILIRKVCRVYMNFKLSNLFRELQQNTSIRT